MLIKSLIHLYLKSIDGFIIFESRGIAGGLREKYGKIIYQIFAKNMRFFPVPVTVNRTGFYLRRNRPCSRPLTRLSKIRRCDLDWIIVLRRNRAISQD